MKIVDELNKLEILQKDIDLMEALPDDVYYEYFEYNLQGPSCEEIKSNLDVDKHRHYETSITVFQTKEGEFFGCRHISNVYSEASMVEDCYWYLKWFEMEEVKTVTYKIKK